MLSLLDPLTRAPLTRTVCADDAALWRGGSQVWPEIDGIPYLRVGREELTSRVVSLIEAGDVLTARAELLRDQDDFARQPPPSLETTLTMSRQEPATFREAMRQLEYGPVAHYFAHRTSTPTFLSGLGLLSKREHDQTLLEICCGVGHYLRFVQREDDDCRRLLGPFAAEHDDTPPADEHGGVDVVWSKLWLARRYLEVAATLVCCDASNASLPFTDGQFGLSLCHDAIYFLPNKAALLSEMRRTSGGLLIGHAHNRLADHGDVAGTPLSPDEYGALADGDHAIFYDDAELATLNLSFEPPIGDRINSYHMGDLPDKEDVLDDGQSHPLAELEDTEAIAWTESQSLPIFCDDWLGVGGPLRLNPLLARDGDQLVPEWPEERFAVEYASAEYLTGPIPTDEQIAWAATGNDYFEDAAMRDFIARRTFIDVPERW